jgi:Uma2 family endonuclease
MSLYFSTIPHFPVKRFTVSEYHRLIDKGAFDEDEPVELLEGWITPKMPRNPPHDSAVSRFQRQFWLRLGDSVVIRTQSAITLEDSEPEPDLAVALGPEGRYDDHHPGASELLLVIEVSVSSLGNDRSVKLPVYAAAGICEYWIVNVASRSVTVDTNPDPAMKTYLSTVTYRDGEAVPMTRFGPRVEPILVHDLLPAYNQPQ